MYRNISYNINKENGWVGEVTLSTWDEDGQRIKYTIDHQSYLYYKDFKGTAKSWFGDDIKLKHFKSVIDRNKWLKTNDVPIFESLTPVNEFIINNFVGNNNDIDEFTKFPLHIAFFDIEIAVEGEFPEPSEAKYPVNLITLYDNFTHKYHIWSLEKIDWEDDGDDVEIKVFKEETNLLRDFINTVVDRDFDVISGWNSFAFDMPYIINRGSQLLDASIINTLSETKKIKSKTINFRPDGRYYNGYKIDGISQLDYMLIYKKYSKMLGAEKSSYKLENICQEELGKGKVEYDGNLRQLYKEDFNLFVKYNKQDVKLLVELEEKLEYLALTRLLCNYSLIEYEDIYQTLPVIVNNLIQFGRKLKLHIPSRRYGEEVEDVKFEGAFVFPTVVGRYDNGIASFDVKSLYPNTMITCNISPEKKVGKVLDGYNGKKIIRLKTGVTKEVSEEQFNKLFREKDYCLTKNGIIFECKTQGILPAFLEFFFNKRIELQQRAKEIQDLPKSKLTKKIKKEFQQCKSSQQVFKIILNSTYGTLGTPYSPYYDVDVAEAVTITGQSVTKGAVAYLEEYFHKKYNHPIEEPLVAAGDTDSCYLNIKYLTTYVLGEGRRITLQDVPKINKELEVVRKEINKWCKKISKEEFYGYKTDRLLFEREIICDVAYFFAKKNYFCHLLDVDGYTPEEGKDFKYKGIALVRSTYPEWSKKVMKNVFEKTIKENWNEQKFINYMNDVYEEFKNLPIIDIATYQNVNQDPNDSSGFLTTKKGDTAGVKGAIFYNQLIERLNLKNNYDLATRGMKLRLLYLNSANKFGISNIAFPEIWPKEFDKIFTPDYKKQFDKNILKPLDIFCECNNWSRWNPEQAEYAVDIMSL